MLRCTRRLWIVWDSKEETGFHVCAVCDYTCKGKAPEKCPECGASQPYR